MTGLVVGVDCGASRARAVVLDPAGKVRAYHDDTLGAAATPDDMDAAVEAVATAVRRAVEQAGVKVPVVALWAGVAGAGRENVRLPLEDRLSGLGLAENVRVGTDAEAAFFASFGSGPGIVLIAGTGSIALASRLGGAAPPGILPPMLRAGGWGPVIDDAGSGYWVGREALRATARATDGRGPTTSLLTSVPEFLGLDDAQGISAWSASATRRDIGALAHVVTAECNKGDAVAKEIISRAVSALTELIITVHARSGPWKQRTPTALVGGLVEEGGPLHAPLLGRLHPLGILDVVVAGDPAEGAARLALTIRHTPGAGLGH